MDYVKIKGWNKAYEAPADWDESISGKCHTAHVKIYHDAEQGMMLHAIAMKPTAEEIEALANGAVFVFEMSVSYMPVCRAYVSTDEEDRT